MENSEIRSDHEKSSEFDNQSRTNDDEAGFSLEADQNTLDATAAAAAGGGIKVELEGGGVSEAEVLQCTGGKLATDDHREEDEPNVDEMSKKKDSIEEGNDSDHVNALNEMDDGDTKAGGAIDPYSYLNRGDFSSEIYKIELLNLPKRFGIAQLKKKLVFMGLNPCKIKCVDYGHYAFVTFRSELEMTKAFEVLQGHVWKNKPIKVKRAAANADPLMLKRKTDAESAKEQKTKKCKTGDTNEDSLTPADNLNDIVTPLWKIPYSEQLVMKMKNVRDFLIRLGKEMEKNNKELKLSEERNLNEGLCCKLHSVKPSPLLHAYRNKCEFSIGVSPEGKDKTVGFRLGSYRDGVINVLEADDCINIPTSMKLAARELQCFLQTYSTKPAFNPTNRQGNWKMATIRTTQSDNVMLNVVFHPQALSPDEIESEKELLKDYFHQRLSSSSSSSSANVKISSLYFQVESDRKEKDEESQCYHLSGEKFIEEEIMQMRFRISPLAFFQVNSLAAEVLYNTIADWCKITPNTILLDVCCGTGTIGLSMAKKVKKVIGIELHKEAVEDAKINALVNGIENAEFLCGKAENLLPSLMWRVAGQEVVVIVDPPRAGLHSDVVRAIRKSPLVGHLLYISCKPNAALSNIVHFTRQISKRISGDPFRVVQAVPVDLFPHTEHYELVLMLEREVRSS